MVLVANPERDRAVEEKEEIAKKYKPGDQVLVSPGGSDAESDDDDRRLLVDGANSHRRRASASHSGDSRRQRSADNRDHHHHNVARNVARAGAAVGNNNESTRRIEHQSSLRSLLSASDVEDNTQEEIVRLIMEEGLLDGIDLSGLDQSQEEELSDRLVQIFLSRHPDRSRQPRRSSDQTEGTRQPEHRRSRSQTLQSQSQNSTPAETSRRPPVSRPHLLGVSTDPHNHRRRASDETRRRRTSPTPVAPASTSETALRPALRSSSDISSQRTRASPSRPRTRESSTASVTRRSTEPEGRASDVWAGITGSLQSVASRQVAASPLTNSPSTTAPTERAFSASTTSLPGVSTNDTQSPTNNVQSSSRRSTATRSEAARQTANRAPSTHYAEPSISCEQCGKTGIQYELHKRCLKCKDGNYHVCLHCYRVDRGCPHYYGVGGIGEMNFNKAHHPALRSTVDMPHVMKSQRYRRPKEGSSRGTSDGKQMTNDNPSSRLQEGMFCDACHSVANGCFWQCDECNESEWGYCRRCVNQGRCCNHPLLPIRRISSESPSPSPTDVTPLGPITPPTQKALPGQATYQVLSFSTECDICKYPIAPSSTRFHCLQCNEGDYDVCTNCYLKLVVSGKISKENGHSGWRRCLKGHRMIVIGYEDHDKGQRRVIVRDIVGGYTLKDEQPTNQPPSSSTGSIASPELGTGDWSWKEGNTKRKKAGRARTSHVNALESSSPSSPSSQTATPISATPQQDRRTNTSTIPPDGGYGLILGASWSYFAEDSCTDELSFPRGAQITEAENINDEWYWGYYAGGTGLFPGAYCTLVREVVS